MKTITKKPSAKKRAVMYLQDAEDHFYGTWKSENKPHFFLDCFPEFADFYYTFKDYTDISQSERMNVTVFILLFCWIIAKSKCK